MNCYMEMFIQYQLQMTGRNRFYLTVFPLHTSDSDRDNINDIYGKYQNTEKFKTGQEDNIKVCTFKVVAEIKSIQNKIKNTRYLSSLSNEDATATDKIITTVIIPVQKLVTNFSRVFTSSTTEQTVTEPYFSFSPNSYIMSFLRELSY